MAKASGIGGVFLRSDTPEALREWYATHLGIDMSVGAWMQQAGPAVMQPFHSDNDYFPLNKAVMLNFRVDDLDGLITQLRAAGIAVKTDPEWDSEIGRFARFHDPDGNPPELWDPAGPAAI